MAVPRLAGGATATMPDVRAAESALMKALYPHTARINNHQGPNAAGTMVRLTRIDRSMTAMMIRRRGAWLVSSAPARLDGTPTSDTIAASVATAMGEWVPLHSWQKTMNGTTQARSANSSQTCAAYPTTYRIESAERRTACR